MTDKEMLELAARAVGYKAHISQSTMPGLLLDDQTFWNPITDDGDALRLAVDLGMQIIPGENYVECVKVMRALRGCRFMEMHKDDKHAATRRVIVRAAAEVGKLIGEKA